MKYRKYGSDYVVRIDRGEELIANLLDFAKKEEIGLASITGLGACDRVKISVYNIAEQKYYPSDYSEAMELTAFVANFSTMHGKPYLHAHATFGREDGTCIGGHLNEAWVCGTSELFIHVLHNDDGTPAVMDRFKDEEDTGLNLFQL